MLSILRAAQRRKRFLSEKHVRRKVKFVTTTPWSQHNDHTDNDHTDNDPGPPPETPPSSSKTPDDNPDVQPRIVEPGENDCCGNGCSDCVWTVYWDAVAAQQGQKRLPTAFEILEERLRKETETGLGLIDKGGTDQSPGD
jgi:hypothetical protein